MSVNENGWGEVERVAKAHERNLELINRYGAKWVEKCNGLPLVKIEVADRLRGCIVEAISQLEQGHQTSAWQILNDSLKIQ